jgi:Putative peptidoglycan binding domain
MNPELERRLRNYGATVDAAATAAEARRRAPANTTDRTAALADLDNVVVLDHRPHRFYRVLAVAAAAVAVIAGAIAFAVDGSSPDTSTADRPITSTAATRPTDHDATEPANVAIPTTAARPTTTITGPQSTTAAAQTVATPPPVCSSYKPSNAYHLDICDSGAAVRLVQERLRASVDSSLNVDGYFGPGTRNAVRTFQQLHGLTVDGQVGPATWALLVPDAPGIDADVSGIVDPDEISTG